MTGMDTASLTAAMISRSTPGAYICALVRPWTVMAEIPASSAILAISTALTWLSSQPLRIFTVTGTGTAWTTARMISPASFGSRMRALPPPLPATLGAGHPMLMSMTSGWWAMASLAPWAITWGSLPKSCTPAGRSASESSNSSPVRRLA